ncbi:hypothetical protein conserved [Leishmania donovani]|nr:hypothetical protein CGC21_20320 [Leishmania donovani]TPP47160.1 hypothetical protein CGC20_34075 [Leishmania donovani]CAJ1991688.1 hypothetical protein conserved [Leishmania donovani]
MRTSAAVLSLFRGQRRLSCTTTAALATRRFSRSAGDRLQKDWTSLSTTPPRPGSDTPAPPSSSKSSADLDAREWALRAAPEGTASSKRGSSFASLAPQHGSGEKVNGMDRTAGLYTHTIVTEADKAPTGVATPATASSVSTGPGLAAERKKYAAIPLRSSGTRAEPGNGSHDASPPPSASNARREMTAPAEAPKKIKTAARPQDGPMVPDYGPLRATGLWSVEEVLDESKKTVDFRRIDDVESEIFEGRTNVEEALVPYAEEEAWKHKLMFEYKFKQTPKHLTWKEMGEEIECMDCVIELDEHRPEELFTILFYFTDKKTGTRDLVWSARNDVSYSEGFTDLLAAVGACLGRSDVHRTIRFDDGVGCTRDLTFRKRSRYTSDVYVAFRPPEKYDKFQRKEEKDEYEASMEREGMSTWGYHPSLMDPEFSELDFKDPEGTYEVAISAHGFSFVVLRAIRRLLARPMRDFYRPSQLMRTAKVRTEDEVGFTHALKGWLGVDEQLYPHYTPIEALQDHWLGKDAPFSLCAIVNKLREMNYLKKENPEFQSWLSVRNHDTHLAIRNMGVKLLGVGASTLFVPVSHNATVNRLLPKPQQRRLESRFSLNAVLGLPDETRKLKEFKQITGHDRITDAPTSSTQGTATVASSAQDEASVKNSPT